MIAVLTDVKTPNFEEVVKQMMLGGNEKYFKALDDNGLTDKFWELCEKFFGYKSDKPNIDDLSACMILTYASSTLKATVPEAMRSYILKKRNDVVVFIRNIMDNVNYQDDYDKLVDRIDKSLRFVTRIQDGLKEDVEKKKDSSLQLADVFACDAFAGLDDIIIDWALEQLNDEILDAQIDGLNIAQVADQRMSKAYHYSERYKNEYTTIKYAYLMMKSVSLMEFSSDIQILVTNYQKESYLIDSYYRWFYYAYDQIEDNSKFSDVRQRVENIYANTYLQKITPKWNENFTNDVMNATDLPTLIFSILSRIDTGASAGSAASAVAVLSAKIIVNKYKITFFTIIPPFLFLWTSINSLLYLIIYHLLILQVKLHPIIILTAKILCKYTLKFCLYFYK